MYKLTLASLLIASSVFAQDCDTPAKYENPKYDKYMKWDNVKMSALDSHVVKANQDELNDLLCELRKRNLTRAYVTALPKDLQSLNVVKDYTVPHPKNSKPTVPVFKLMLKKETKDPVEYRKSQNLKVGMSILNKGIKSYEFLPKEYVPYTKTIPYQKATYSIYIEDPYIEVEDTQRIMTGMYREFLADGSMPCYTKEVTDSIRLLITKSSEILERISSTNTPEETIIALDEFLEADKSMNKLMNSVSVKLRYFIDKDGFVRHIDSKNNTGTSDVSPCFSKLVDISVRVTLRDYDFKPALDSNGVPVDSYVETTYVFTIYVEQEITKTRRKPLN